MAEYIDREAIEKFIEKGLNNPDKSKAYGFDAIEILFEVHFMPAADVAEVKHGEWIYHECVSSYDGTISGHSCSVCKAFVHEETFDNDTFYKKYCGNCGARMDGKDREEAE